MASAINPSICSSARPNLASNSYNRKPFKKPASSCMCKLKFPPSRSPKANISITRQLFHVLNKERDCLKAFTILQDAVNRKGYTPATSFCQSLIHSLGCAGHLDHMRIVLSLMSKPTEQAFCHIVAGYAKVRMIDHALAVLHEMEVAQLKPTTKIYTVLLNFLVDENKFLTVESLYSQMRYSGIQPDAKIFNILIKAYCKKARMNEAVELLHKMKPNGCIPDTVTYNTLVNGFCRQGRMEEAAKLLAEMCRNGLKPDTVTFPTLISGFYKQGRMKEAAKLMEEMHKNGLNPGT